MCVVGCVCGGQMVLSVGVRWCVVLGSGGELSGLKDECTCF